MKPMQTVPTYNQVILHMPDGSSFRGELQPFEGEDDKLVFGWVCLEEGKAPDNWTDDVCWAVNENDVASTKPVGWSPVE